MYTYESVEKFVERCLNYANPGNARIFEAQAFGVIQFVSEQCYNVKPAQVELEAKLTQQWNDVWHNLFTQIYLEPADEGFKKEWRKSKKGLDK